MASKKLKQLGFLVSIVITAHACNLETAETVGRVVKVADGDSLTVQTSTNERIKVRLREIDAPERGQAFGSKSRAALSEICAGKMVRLKDDTKDQYGRTLARVYCDGVDANAYMLQRGLAWVYDSHVIDRSFYKFQDEARSKKIGLWQDKNPMPPWQYRYKNKK